MTTATTKGPARSMLGDVTVPQFMRRHWQRAPLVVREASREAPFIDRRALFALATRDDVESRLVIREGRQWQVTHGPIAARLRPAVSQRAWTMLVQGVDLHLDAAHALLRRFAFVPWARLDDVMVSWASDGGGVGPHTDAYDVFLLQLHGRRRWRVASPRAWRWRPNTPLKLLADFTPDIEWTLEPGDMLYLPPGWGHDGIADGECLTASIGFRAPSAHELTRDLLARLADDGDEHVLGDGVRYRDPRSAATAAAPGRLPPSMLSFARTAMTRALAAPDALTLALGEWLTEPKPRVFFEAADDGAPAPRWLANGLRLDRRSRMLYDDRFVFLNGESFAAAGRDALALRALADQRTLDARRCRTFTATARATIDSWVAAGWVVANDDTRSETREAGPTDLARNE